MQIDYRQLRAALTVPDELAFGRAAERLNISQLATDQLDLATLMGATVTRGACQCAVQRMSCRP